MIAGTVDLADDVVLAGKAAVRRRLAESGGLGGTGTKAAPRSIDLRTLTASLSASKRSSAPTFEDSTRRTAVGASGQQRPLPRQPGAAADADLGIETDLALRSLMTGELSPAEAIRSGRVRVTGNHDLLERFVEVFHIPPAPFRERAGTYRGCVSGEQRPAELAPAAE